MAFGVTSSVSKQCNCYLLIRFVDLTMCLVVNFLYKCTWTIKVLIDHYYPKHLTAAISILIFLKQSCKRMMLKFLSSLHETKNWVCFPTTPCNSLQFLIHSIALPTPSSLGVLAHVCSKAGLRVTSQVPASHF